MRMDLVFGRRVLKNGLVLATTLITCTALQAEDQSSSSGLNSPQNSGGPQSAERATGTSSVSGSGSRAGQSGQQQGGQMQQEKFVQKAMKSGQMEVQMGQLAQQKGQNQQVKQFGQTLVQDHTQANQQLQQIAQKLNISGSDHQAHGEDADKHAKHQQHMEQLRNKSGAEFDREFTKMAVKHHKKDIQEFEQAQNQVQDPQLKSFIQQTLPKLRQHLQMAQANARTLGLDEATLSADEQSDTATGAPAAGQSGSTPSGSDKPRSSVDHDADGASIAGDAQLGDRSVSSDISADVDTSDRSVSADVDADADVNADTDTDGKVFQKGDGKVLGLPTSKTDGKFLGIIPNPRADKDSDAEVTVDADADTDEAIGGAAQSETGTSTDGDVKVEVETDADRDK